MNIAKEIASRDFGKKAIKALEKKGIEFVGVQQIPGDCGTWANTSRAYVVAFKECAYVKAYFDVLDLVSGKIVLGEA